MTDGLSEAYDMKKWDVFCEYNDLLLENDQLQAENEKLRELVRIMHGELVSCEDNGYVCGGHKFDERVRELGIEVNGCE